MYPIEAFISTRIKELRLKKTDIARNAGYSNTAKGLRRLEEFTKTGKGTPQITSNIHTILCVPESAIVEKIEETQRIMEAEEEARFRAAYFPHLYVRTERGIPSQICICGITGMHLRKQERFPDDFASRSIEEQDALIQKAIKRSLERGEGGIPFFGKILGFVLSTSYDEPQESRRVFDIEGREITDASYKERHIGCGMIRVSINRGKTNITGILAKTD
jgi:hypothetical protein